MSAPKYPWTARQISAALAIVFVEGLFIGAAVSAAILKITRIAS